MNSSINLVKGDTRENLGRAKRTFILRIISIVFLSFIFFLSVVLFLLNLRVSVNSIKKDQAATLRSISLEKNKFAKLNLINDRLKGIRDILRDRKNYTNTLDTLLSQIPQGVTTSSLRIEKKDVTLTVNSLSLLPINRFLNNIIDLSVKKSVVKDMTIESLTIDSKTGIYSLSVKAKI